MAVDEQLEPVEETEIVEEEEELDDSEQPDGNSEHNEDKSEDSDDEEVVVTLGDEQPEEDEQPRDETPAIREMRARIKEQNRQLKEYEKKLKQVETKPAEAEITLKKKPTLEDFDYDSEQFEQALDAWHEDKRKFDEQEKLKKDAEAKQAEAWNQKLAKYEEAKKKVKIRNFEEAESNVVDNLNQTQQGVIIQYADNPALLVSLIGSSKDRLEELSKIEDPGEFIYKIAKMESQMKVYKKQGSPSPDKPISEGAIGSGMSKSKLDKLKEKAQKTGDYSEYFVAKRKMKQE